MDSGLAKTAGIPGFGIPTLHTLITGWTVVQAGTLKSRDLTSRHWTTWDHVARVDIARPDNARPCSWSYRPLQWLIRKHKYFSTSAQNQIMHKHKIKDETSQAPVPAVTTSTASESSAASTSDDCCEVCLVAPRAGFALVPCWHARYCEPCAMRVSEMAAGCPVCRTDITMVIRVFS